MGFIDRIKDNFGRAFTPKTSEESEEYVEVDTGRGVDKAKIMVKPFVMRDFEDVKTILETLRTGYTIALIDVKYLKDKDMVELKRAISKIKKTCDAIEGDIAGFDNLIIVTPAFAKIYRGEKEMPVVQEKA
ncbi:MAG: cell division protein SepF [Nanoarchaeota archaeon]